MWRRIRLRSLGPKCFDRPVWPSVWPFPAEEIRLSRLFELQDTVAQARAELASEADAGDVLGAACATLSMADRCESLHMELSGTRIREKSGGRGPGNKAVRTFTAGHFFLQEWLHFGHGQRLLSALFPAQT